MKIKSKGIIISHVYDERTRRAYLGVSFPTNGGGRKFEKFDPELRDSANKFRKALVKAGAKLKGTRDVQERKLSSLLESIPDKQKILTDFPGFRVNKDGLGYVCGSHMLGSAKGRYKWEPNSTNRGVGKRKGTLEGWQEKVAPIASLSTYGMFSVFAALASSLNSYVRLSAASGLGSAPLMSEGAAFNYSAESSTGKTSLSRLIAGVSGDPEAIMDWDFTRRGLEEYCAAHNDGPLVIDDTDKITQTDMSTKVALKLANQTIPKGQSKMISGGARKEYPMLTWSTFGFSSSQQTFDEEAQAVGFTRSIGEKCRLFNIPVPPGSKGGIFDRIKGSDEQRKNEGSLLISKLEAAVATHYGVLMPAWINFLLDESRVVRIQELVAQFVARVAPNAGGQEGRVAKKFGVVYAAGVLAIEGGLLPWPPTIPMEVVRKLYRPARKALVSDSELAIARLKTLAEAVSSDDKFPEHDGDTLTYAASTLGIRTEHGGAALCCIRDEDLTKMAGGGAVKKAMVKWLSEEGAIVKGQGHAGTVQMRLPISVDGHLHDRPRFWAIKLESLTALVNDAA